MSNAEIDRMFAYHERTKHSYASVYSGGWTLDWDNQPNPFRRYAGAPRVELPPPEGGPRPEAGTSSCLRAHAASSINAVAVLSTRTAVPPRGGREVR